MSSRNSLQVYNYGVAGAGASTSSLVTSSLSTLADPPIRYMDAATMDYFLIEMVHTLRTSSSVATERTKAVEKEMIEAGLLPPVRPGKVTPSGSVSGTQTPTKGLKKELRESGSTGSLVLKTGVSVADDPEDEALRIRLEAIGVHVGGNIAERLCRDRQRFAETLDAVKFVCKEVWAACWEKQVDNLRTNHRGVYVLQDNQFKPISRISSFDGSQDALQRAKIYTAMPAGIIKGALARMGYQATVQPEITQLPQCTFQVKLPRGS